MGFTSLNDLLSLDDVKRLGIPTNSQFVVSSKFISSLFSDKYQKKLLFEGLSKELRMRLVEKFAIFEQFQGILNTEKWDLIISPQVDGSFFFSYDFKEVLAWFLAYYIVKYPSLDDIRDLDERLSLLSQEEIYVEFEKVFLRIFRIVNASLSLVYDDEREQVMSDRRLAKFMAKNIREIASLAKEPICISELEGINKDYFLLTLSLKAMYDLVSSKRIFDEECILTLEEEQIITEYVERYYTLTHYFSEKTGQEYNSSFVMDGSTYSYQIFKRQYDRYFEKYPNIIDSYREKMDVSYLFQEYLKDARVKIRKDDFVKAIKLNFELFPKGKGKERESNQFLNKSTVSQDIKRQLYVSQVLFNKF